MSKLYSPVKTVFHIPTNQNGPTVSVQIAAPDIKAENLPLSTWTSSVVLARQLHKLDFLLPEQDPLDPGAAPIPVLELGAGTGLAGLSAACLWKTTAVLTDLAPIVPGLAANIALNTTILRQCGGAAACGALDWSSPRSLTLGVGDNDKSARVPSSRKARLILAADTIYDADHPALLASAVFEWLERSAEARFCVCYPLRVAYLDEIRELWQRLEDGGLECVREDKETHVGDSPNGDDEALCEWSVWRWKEPGVANA